MNTCKDKLQAIGYKLIEVLIYLLIVFIICVVG